MLNQMQVFSNEQFGAIRTIQIDGEPWFVGRDVALALGYADTADALKRHVDEEDKLTRRFTDSGQSREMYVISESGVYSLVFSSKLDNAKSFKRWVTHDILPSIRKHGGYLAGQESMTPDELMASALIYANKKIKEYDERIATLTAQNQHMAPKAEYFDELVERNLLTNFRDTAKELGLSQSVFINWCIDNGFVYRDQHGQLKPYAQHVDNGYFTVKDGKGKYSKWAGPQTLITAKGKSAIRLLLQVRKPTSHKPKKR